MGRKCSVEYCLSDSDRQEDTGVTFHKIPLHPDLRPKWLSLCHIPENKKSSKIIYVCSRHFLRADFCNFKGKKYMLKQGVLPSVFPWDKSRLEAIKASAKKDQILPKKEETSIENESSSVVIKEEAEATIKTEIEDVDDTTEEIPVKEEYTSFVKQEQFESLTEEDTSFQVAEEEGEEEGLMKSEIGETIVQGASDSPIKFESESNFSDIPAEVSDSNNQAVNLDILGVDSSLENFVQMKLPQPSIESVNFAINSKIEALDFNNMWYPAHIVEVDYEENEVLIQYEKLSSKPDEWISMNSSRLRPFTPKGSEKYEIGERCLAAWSDSRKFPATVTKIMENDTYEVLFDDGYVKSLKGHRMSKTVTNDAKASQASPLFDPVKGSKQDRREKKRKLNVAALFRKRPNKEGSSGERRKSKGDKSKPGTSAQTSNILPQNAEENPPPALVPTEDTPLQNWRPTFDKQGKPVGEPSTLEMSDGVRKSFIVPDPRLPESFVKHLSKRISGQTVGKWETVIVGPDNRRFRNRSEIRHYLELHPELGLTDEIFDFSIYKSSRKRSLEMSTSGKKREAKKPKLAPETASVPPVVEQAVPVEESSEGVPEDPNTVKIIYENDSYKCPVDGCGKNFRRENLALMHVKHYHPEFSKFMDSTPNVADLAYARTVGESLDKSPGPPKAATLSKLSPKITALTKPPKFPQSPLAEAPPPDTSPNISEMVANTKDKEIIKLLNQKPSESADEAQPLPSGLPPSMYPDIKLKDILNKTDDMPHRDDVNLKALCATRPPVGIKTLLPVVRSNPLEGHGEEREKKRKRGVSEMATDTAKGKTTPPTDTPSPIPTTPHQLMPPQQQQQQQPQQQGEQPSLQLPPEAYPFNDIIIEGGKIIKLERMKQEEIINCTCGFPEEDGLMIQCELCLCWQHAYCNNIQRESEVPEKYVCWICQNPVRERSSMKHVHDQEWLTRGTLPTASFHSRDEEGARRRVEQLKKCHDLSGGMLELREYVHALGVKLKIAESKNHPKLYLWSKPWEKLPLPEKVKDTADTKDIKQKSENSENVDHQYLKNENELEMEKPDASMLMMILKAGKEEMPKLDLNSLMNNNIAPIIPQPQAAINSDDCRLNLLDHISHAESLVEERLDDFEKQIEELEQKMNTESAEDYPKTRQTLQMLMKDLDTLKEFSQIPML